MRGFQNERGSALLLVLGTLLVVSTLSILIMSGTGADANLPNNLMASSAIRLIKSNIMTIVSSQSGGSNSAQKTCAVGGASHPMCCMTNGLKCMPPTLIPSLALSIDGVSTYYDPISDPTAGFDIYGKPCTGYPAPVADAQKLLGCIFRADLKAQIDCDGTPGACDSPPQAKITVTISNLSVAEGVLMNFANQHGDDYGKVKFE